MVHLAAKNDGLSKAQQAASVGGEMSRRIGEKQQMSEPERNTKEAPSSPIKDQATVKQTPHDQAANETGAGPVFVERSARGAWMVIGATLCLSFGLALFSFSQIKTSSRYIESSVYTFAEYGKKLGVVGCAEKALEWNRQCTALKSLCVASLQRMVGACLNAGQRIETCKNMNLGRNQGNFTFMRCKPKNLQRDREAKKACAYTYGAVWSYCHLVRRLKRKGLSMPAIVPPAK